jgi:hypothetical protein
MGAKTPEAKRRAKYAAYMRDMGTPLTISDEEQAQLIAHITKLHRRGMSHQGICDSVPGDVRMHDSVLTKIMRGQVDNCHRDTYDYLMRARFVQPTDHRSGRRIDGTGHRRRLRGLVADGWTMTLIGEIVGVVVQAVHQQAISERPVHASTVANFVPWYEKLSAASPSDYGATKHAISRAQGVARRRGWDPSSCWDDDTIDDPAAHPEFTGECGRVRGIMIHLRDSIPMCVRCTSVLESSRKRAANPIRIYEMHREGKGSAEIAQALGISRDVVQQYCTPLNVVTQHRLSMVDSIGMRAICELCGPVTLRSTGKDKHRAVKVVCYNSIEKKE